MKNLLWGVLAGSLLLAGCQLPLGQKSQGFQLTLNFSQPSYRSLVASRVLLPTAAQVTLTVASEGKTVSTQSVPTAGASSVVFSLNLPPFATYNLVAEARNASGSLVFAGSTTIKLVSSTSGNLYLFPVDSAGSLSGWPIVSSGPTNQPAGQPVIQGLSLAPGESQSFLLNWGDGSAFTFQTEAGLEIYLQSVTGTPLTIPSDSKTVLKNAAPSNAWITYYARSAPVSLGSLGRFTIPIQAVSLSGPASVYAGESGTITLSTGSLVPSNATETAADFVWTASPANFLSLGAPGTGGIGFTANTSEGAVAVTAQSKSNPAVTATWTVNVNGPPPSGTVTATFTTAPFEVLDFGTAVSLDSTDVLEVSTTNTTLQTQGTDWEWLLDDTAVDVSAEPNAWTVTLADLPDGLHTLSVGVTVGALRYSGNLSITVNPLEAVQ